MPIEEFLRSLSPEISREKKVHRCLDKGYSDEEIKKSLYLTKTWFKAFKSSYKK